MSILGFSASAQALVRKCPKLKMIDLGLGSGSVLKEAIHIMLEAAGAGRAERVVVK